MSKHNIIIDSEDEMIALRSNLINSMLIMVDKINNPFLQEFNEDCFNEFNFNMGVICKVLNLGYKHQIIYSTLFSVLPNGYFK